MLPRPIHRWKSFWLGIVVLAFLGWAWGRSVGDIDQAYWRWGADRNLIIENSHGSITGTLFTHPHHDPRFGFGSIEVEVRKWFGRSFRVKVSKHMSSVAIPHWILILLFLVPWTGWLGWRLWQVEPPVILPAGADPQSGNEEPSGPV